MEKVRPWCGQPSDLGRLNNRTELFTIVSSCVTQYTDVWQILESVLILPTCGNLEFFVFAIEVTIFSYHNPLVYLRECAPKSAKLTRWALKLQEFIHADSNIFHTSVYIVPHVRASIGNENYNKLAVSLRALVGTASPQSINNRSIHKMT